MSRRVDKLILAFLLTLVLSASAPVTAKSKKEKPAVGSAPAVLWREPVDIESRDLFFGSGGKEHLPAKKLVYIRENLNGINPKFDVRDSAGTRWGVKMGEEAKPETAAARLVWAVGYFTADYYYLPELTLSGMPPLHRGKELISKDGVIKGVRLKRHPKGAQKIGFWHWDNNPFAGSREMDGLRIMMELICNTDLKLEHRVIYDVHHEEQRYYIIDLGGSFGKAGLGWNRTKGVLKDYASKPLVRRDHGEYLDFYYFKHIPREHAKWIGSYLARLSDVQIKDAFLAAGYSPEEADGFSRCVRQKINELVHL